MAPATARRRKLVGVILAGTSTGAVGLLLESANPARLSASQWDRCFLTDLGSCLAPYRDTTKATRRNPYRCLVVNRQRCTEEHGSWLGPKLPAYWQRLENTRSPCYRDEASAPGDQVRCLPYLFNLSPPKCGTDDLYKRLLAHPAVVQGALIQQLRDIDGVGNVVKEPKYWENAPATNTSLEVYAEEFKGLALAVQGRPMPRSVRSNTVNFLARHATVDHSKLFSIDFSATTYDTSPIMISDVIPEARFVAMLRNPVDRAESHFNFAYHLSASGPRCHVGRFYNADGFHDNVVNVTTEWNQCSERKALTECWRLLNKRRTMGCGQWSMSAKFVLSGLYSVYLSWFLEYFPKEHFFIRKLEHMDFIENATLASQQVSDLLTFMGVGDIPVPEATSNIAFGQFRQHQQKKGSDYVRMHAKTRELLQNFYAPYNKQLRDMFNDDSLTW